MCHINKYLTQLDVNGVILTPYRFVLISNGDTYSFHCIILFTFGNIAGGGDLRYIHGALRIGGSPGYQQQGEATFDVCVLYRFDHRCPGESFIHI